MNGKQQPPGKTILAPIPVNIKYNCALFRDTNIIGNPYPSQLSCKFPYAPAGSHKATDQTPSSGEGSGPREEKAQAFGREENKYYKSHELSSLRARNRRDETRWKAQFPTAINPTRARIAEQTSFPSLPRPQDPRGGGRPPRATPARNLRLFRIRDGLESFFFRMRDDIRSTLIIVFIGIYRMISILLSQHFRIFFIASQSDGYPF